MRKYKKLQFKCLIGVDEAGRGPLAGPLSLCALFVKNVQTLEWFVDIKDSKKLSEKKREWWFTKIKEAEAEGLLRAEVVFTDNKTIDEKGMGYCLKESVARALAPFVGEKEKTLVLLDGSLYAPREFPHQKTIIRGDEKERSIAMASVLAKVTRDREMCRLAKEYPEYGFEAHKGYGTKGHYLAIKAHGVSAVHRKSFLQRISNSNSNDQIPIPNQTPSPLTQKWLRF